jgi:hypothetical protein
MLEQARTDTWSKVLDSCVEWSRYVANIIPLFFYECLLRFSGANWRASEVSEEAQAWGRALAKNRTVKKLRSAGFIFGDDSHHSNHCC